MDRNELKTILNAIKDVRVAVVGDICLDVYWRADMRLSRLSRETPHYPLPVTEERFSLGGGGNVMANAAALGIRELIPVSLLSRDWRGRLAQDLLRRLGVTEKDVLFSDTRITPAYCKPLRAGISDVVYEDPRLDFENRAPLSPADEAQILSALEAAADRADVIAVSDQLSFGVITPKVREKLCALGKTVPVVADSRDNITAFRQVILKPNEVEAAAAAGIADGSYGTAAAALSAKTGAPVIVTLGAEGALWYENGALHRTPGIRSNGPVDPVGAGDTFLAAFCAAYAATKNGAKAIEIAALAAGVTVRKIGQTGTASPEEILAINKEETEKGV